MADNIIIKEARRNNLKNIDVIIPRNKLVVITVKLYLPLFSFTELR